MLQAFQQEDSFVEGTGLGMNLVAKIVKAFEGKIDVQSEKGVGTCFTVTLPLEHSRIGIERDLTHIRPLTGVSVAIIEPSSASKETSAESGRSLLLSSVQRTLGEAGAYTSKSDWDGTTETDVYLVTEVDVREEIQRLEDGRFTEMRMSPDTLSNRPFVVICDNALSQRRLRTSGLGLLASEHVELISQPAGPERLAKAILDCMKKKREIKKATGLAAAVKNIPVVIPLPGSNKPPQRMAMRPLPHATADAPRDNRLAPLRHAKASSIPNEGRPSLVKFQRSLSSEERLPRLPKRRSSNETSPPGSRGTFITDAASKTVFGSGISLLLVDDNPINLRLLVTYAERNGHHKTIATEYVCQRRCALRAD